MHSFGKRDHAIKRNLNVPVVVRGWLYKQVSRASSAASGRESKSCVSKQLLCGVCPPPVPPGQLGNAAVEEEMVCFVRLLLVLLQR